jgi:hypothetical protein
MKVAAIRQLSKSNQFTDEQSAELQRILGVMESSAGER